MIDSFVLGAQSESEMKKKRKVVITIEEEFGGTGNDRMGTLHI